MSHRRPLGGCFDGHVPLGTAGGRLVGQSCFPQELRTEPRDSKATTEVYCLCPLMWSGRCFKCYGFSQTEWRCFCETHSQGFLFQWGYHTVIARHVRGWTGITFAESPGCHWQHWTESFVLWRRTPIALLLLAVRWHRRRKMSPWVLSFTLRAKTRLGWFRFWRKFLLYALIMGTKFCLIIRPHPR